ncbi:MAG: RloB family protein [Candidatus Methylacidiphilales bacterium]|nr:RloB family protein [Candidatus Methylacidiphilales bacterium]
MSKKEKPKSYFGGGCIQAPIDRVNTQTTAPKSILIVTEGQITEPSYFRHIAKHWNLHPHVASIEPGGEGIPLNLVRKAKKIQKERIKKEKSNQLPYNQIAKFDETWIVFDTEHAARQNRLEDGVEEAKRCDFKIAHSTPCFEFWLVLHYALRAPPMETCDEACRLFEEVAQLNGNSYSKANGAAQELITRLMPLTTEAVKNACRQTQQQRHEDFPPNPSTAVHLLLASMHDTLPELLKKRYPLL